MNDNNDSPVEFTLGRFFIAVGIVAALLVTIAVGVHLNGTDHGPTPEQQCAIDGVIECDVRP
jgi:hypothetical protein